MLQSLLYIFVNYWWNIILINTLCSIAYVLRSTYAVHVWRQYYIDLWFYSEYWLFIFSMFLTTSHWWKLKKKDAIFSVAKEVHWNLVRQSLSLHMDHCRLLHWFFYLRLSGIEEGGRIFRYLLSHQITINVFCLLLKFLSTPL